MNTDKNTNKMKYKLGLVVGRFQPFHNGHVYIIDEALKIAEEVCILVGSSQESGTEHNPFSYELRRDLIESTYKSEVRDKRLFIRPLPDAGLGNVSAWGDYVIKKAVEYMGRIPDVFVTGEESRRTSWFANYSFDEISVTKVGEPSSCQTEEPKAGDSLSCQIEEPKAGDSSSCQIEEPKAGEPSSCQTTVTNYSATGIRKYLLLNDRDSFAAEVPPEILGRFDELRNILLESVGNTKTQSI